MKISFTKLLVLLMLIVITFFSCNKRSKNIQYNDISIQDSLNEKGEKRNPLNYKANKKDTILDEINTKKGEVVFLSFYPNMSTKAFEYLKKKEHKKGNLIFSDNYKFEIPLSRENLYFQLENNQDKFTLHSYNTKVVKGSFRSTSESGKKVFDELKSELIDIYSKKYGDFEIHSDEYFSRNYNGKLGINIKRGDASKMYVFKSNSQVVGLNFNFSSDYLKNKSKKMKIDDSENSKSSTQSRKRTYSPDELDDSSLLDKNQGFKFVGGDTKKIKRKILKEAYKYDISIDYYSIESFQKIRRLRINDSLNNVTMLKQKQNRRIRLKDSLEKDAKRKIDEILEKI